MIISTLRSVFSACRDFFTLYIPFTPQKKGYAFIVHPRDASDTLRKYPILRYILSVSQLEFFLQHFFPVTLSEIGGVTDQNNQLLKGWVIASPYTAKQMMKNKESACSMVVKAARLAEKKGARYIGLGALTASLTRGGLDVAENVKSRVVTGRLFTSRIIVDTALSVLEKFEEDRKNETVAIVGAAGSIGTACAQILVKEGFKKLILVDLKRKDKRVKWLEKKLIKMAPGIQLRTTHDLSSLRDAGIIIAVTNTPEAVIRSEHLKPGAVVIDDAQPTDVDPSLVYDRADVLVLEGGVVCAEGIDTHFNFGLRHKNDLYSCLAETIIFSHMEYEGDYGPGEVTDLDWNALKILESGAKRLGMKVGKLQNVLKEYTEKDFESVKQARYNRE